MNKRKTPRIRFKGFTDDWEQRKLGEIYARSGEKNDGSVGIDRNITVATMQFKDDVKVSTTEYLKTYYTFNVGDIAFEGHQSKEFRFGRFVENDIGNGIVSHIFAVFRPIVEYDLKFWKYAINNERLMQRVLSRSTKASTMMHDLVTDDFLNESFLVPTIEEQRKIGDYFSHLDHLITLHQRKLEKLKIVKKAMLENCFPKNGEKVPRFRFSGFTGDWEQRKLSELVAKYEDPVETPHGGYIRLGIRSHAKGTFHEYVEPGHELETAKMHRVATNKLIFNITFAWEHAVAIANENDAGKLVSHRFPQFTLLESLRPEFLKYVILDEGFHHNLYLASPGGAGRNRVLKIEEALDYPIYYPSLEEQHKIGGLLNKLNDLITLHQRKLEKLKIIKKSFLEKMFV